MGPQDAERVTAWTVASALGELPLDVAVEADCQGQRLDVLATTPSGATLGIVLKRWSEPTPAMLDKARHEADLLAEAGGVDRAFLVIPTLADDQQTDALRNLPGLGPAVIDWLVSVSDVGVRGPAARPRPESSKKHKQIFVAMPFATRFEDTYYLGIIPAAKRASASCIRVDQQYFGEQIINQIHADISRADAVIADMTGGNPNVTYELGYAHSLKKPTVHLSSTPVEQLPFDLRQWQMIPYSTGQIYRLKSQLETVLVKLLSSPSESPS